MAKTAASEKSQQENITAQSKLKGQEITLGEQQLQQQNQFSELYQGKEFGLSESQQAQQYALADKYAKENLGLSLADIYAQVAQQKHELPLTLQAIGNQAASRGSFVSKGRIQGQQEAVYNEQQALGSLGRQAKGAKLSYSEQIAQHKMALSQQKATDALAMQKLKAGDILGYQQLKSQDALKRQGLSLETQKQLMDLQNQYAKELSVSDVQNALVNGAISAGDAKKRLMDMGYSGKDADLIVGGYTSKGGGGPGGKDLSKSDLEDMVRRGLMSPDQFVKNLESEGYSAAQAQALLADTMAKGPLTDKGTGGVPAGLSGIYYLKGKDATGKSYSDEISVGRGGRITDNRAAQMRTHPFYGDITSSIQGYFSDAAASGQKPSLKGLMDYVQQNTNVPKGSTPDQVAQYVSLVLYDLSQGGPPAQTGGASGSF